MPTRNPNTDSTQRTRLPNGLAVVLRPMAHVESVAIGVWVRVGGRYERPALAGTAHFLEHLLFKGTRHRSCEQLKQAIEGIGGSLNGFTAEEFTCYMAKVPAKHLARAMAVLADMVLCPRLSAEDIDREREVILEEIRMVEDAPAQYVHDIFNQLLWPDHPLGNLLAGTVSSVRGISRGTIVDYWRRNYHPRNLLIACTGAFDPDAALREARKAYGRASGGPIPHASRAPRFRTGPQVRLLHKATEQTHLCLGTPAIPRTHPQRFALELLHVLLGANMSSRLFHEVREKRGLVYDIGTYVKRYQDTGAFVISAGCDAGKLPRTLQTVMKELVRIKEQPVSAREFRRAKDFYHGQLVIGLEDTMDYMLWIGEQAITAGRIGTPAQIIEAIERVTARQVQQAARSLFASRRMFLAVIGPVPETQAESLRCLCETVQ